MSSTVPDATTLDKANWYTKNHTHSGSSTVFQEALRRKEESVCSSSDSGVRNLSCCGHVSRCCTESACLFACHRCRSTVFEARFRSRAHVLVQRAGRPETSAGRARCCGGCRGYVASVPIVGPAHRRDIRGTINDESDDKGQNDVGSSLAGPPPRVVFHAPHRRARGLMPFAL